MIEPSIWMSQNPHLWVLINPWHQSESPFNPNQFQHKWKTYLLYITLMLLFRQMQKIVPFIMLNNGSSRGFFMFLLPQANGCSCVDFGSTHPIDGLFWSLPIYLLGSFLKYECWLTDLIMSLYHFLFFWVVICLFVSRGFISL